MSTLLAYPDLTLRLAKSHVGMKLLHLGLENVSK